MVKSKFYVRSSRRHRRNSEDRHIPMNGKNTYVLGKNVLPGDTVCLRGNTFGLVTSVRRDEDANEVILTVQNENLKTFEMIKGMYDRTYVREYPVTRFNRRRYSRNRAGYDSMYDGQVFTTVDFDVREAV